MQYITEPIAQLIKFTFDYILIPLGELPTAVNPNTLFMVIGFVGLIYWLFLQKKFNDRAKETGELK